jgi:hypothetical protein
VGKKTRFVQPRRSRCAKFRQVSVAIPAGASVAFRPRVREGAAKTVALTSAMVAAMSNPSSAKNKTSRQNPKVPRDRDVDAAPTRDTDSPRAAADVNPPDEAYTDQDKPLVAGSREARALHDQPPRTKGTLGVGTAGDAARPTKPGIHNKTVPPRGSM